ncbi:MAG: phospho-N-acetylmuramoyl-pentapeptide-transferase [Ezakiella sp.]|nr:phospho-N-acetylmuramoyl-pentapeptide-transferase [Ezakiella sp.]MDD7472061.1 phospho-N-acetylmuramoyl-pentapeptide-transferase [Bacillota bacterium]MDY3924025.1 phospho-N-acetylmuramoyl-pentapeptide-transferase [Ezakiella sp.]
MDYLYMLGAFILSIILGKPTVNYLRKLKMGQEIRQEGPKSHYVKSGTPTMGGIFIIATYVICAIVYMILKKGDLKTALFLMVAPILYGLIGFLDDYEKITKKTNLGLTAKQKIFLQILFAALITIYARFVLKFDTVIELPFTKKTLDIGIFYYLVMILMITSSTNAVNLTDGLDGLCGGVSAVVLVAVGVVSRMYDASEVQYFSHILSGALLGFLVYNIYPAKVFMGDTGSLFIGGYLATVFLLLKQPLHLILIGLVYVVETLSVIIQVLHFKRTGKRFFRMAPIHHHFEMKGYQENKIVTAFVFVTFIIALVYIGLSRYGIL